MKRSIITVALVATAACAGGLAGQKTPPVVPMS